MRECACLSDLCLALPRVPWVIRTKYLSRLVLLLLLAETLAVKVTSRGVTEGLGEIIEQEPEIMRLVEMCGRLPCYGQLYYACPPP